MKTLLSTITLGVLAILFGAQTDDKLAEGFTVEKDGIKFEFVQVIPRPEPYKYRARYYSSEGVIHTSADEKIILIFNKKEDGYEVGVILAPQNTKHFSWPNNELTRDVCVAFEFFHPQTKDVKTYWLYNTQKLSSNSLRELIEESITLITET